MTAVLADPAWLVPRLRTALATRTWRPSGAPEGLRAAAVLIPLIVRDGRLGVLFTQRAAGLRDHSGQVSFPGGKREPADRSATVTALREAEEELGLPVASVDVLGRLDELVMVTSFRVTPVVGLVTAPPESWRPSTEVAEVFEVPLDALAAPTTFELVALPAGAEVLFDRPVPASAREREVHTYRHGERFVWGATGRMVTELLAVVRAL